MFAGEPNRDRTVTPGGLLAAACFSLEEKRFFSLRLASVSKLASHPSAKYPKHGRFKQVERSEHCMPTFGHFFTMCLCMITLKGASTHVCMS